MKRSILFLLTVFTVFSGCKLLKPAPETVVEEKTVVVEEKTIVVQDTEETLASIRVYKSGPLDPEAEAFGGPTQAISGLKGVKIEYTDVHITLKNDRLKETIPAGTRVDWIHNLPDGLTARIRQAVQGTNEIVILVNGVPKVTKNERIAFVIPQRFLSGSTKGTFLSNEAKFEILDGNLQLTSHVGPAPRIITPININGTVREELTTVDIRVNLFDTSLKSPVEEPIFVDWIVNIPRGLRAELQPAPANQDFLILTLSGTPMESRNEPVKVVVPGEMLANLMVGNLKDLHVPNEQIFFRIVGASVRDVLIDGSVAFTIASKDVFIHLDGAELAADIAPGTVVPWITNIPAGLTARVRRARTSESLVVITVAGIPQVESDEALSLRIPPGVLKENQNVTILRNIMARFSISANTERYTVLDVGDGTTNPNWLNSQRGPLNVPILPSMKDFDGLGVISVSAVMVEKLGADNQYHWSGQKVSYSKLMEEAKKLGAHAIINVVIDWFDTEEFVEVKRELAPDHVWTDDELSKMSKGILTEIREGKTRYSLERSHVLTRTYTGTALAIKYVQGLNYYEAEMLRNTNKDR